ncbi:Nucleotide-binding universal stress protein, UspA family [Candidatus Nitrotoga sp. BS]|uniref:universal stress protein n=1 Tax=Candidatus Nitrotoga sp. BS TaxID=2890408 RepID=UPI001EF25938|nr:universal stress protein [Candidatus Nitrotoga sp. BS]CAH1202054.1 Nucleotide-binding universal stress protein, UspA family [Candidatus Nitrotoga sp. BS]
MKPITTFLAATDFSTTAGRAEERAALLAAEHGACLTMLHSLSGLALEHLRGRLLHGYASAEAQLIRHYEDALRLLAENLAERWQIEVTPLITVGQTHCEISRAAQEIGADMVILGAMGEHPAREFFLGATAERVIREAAIPVLVVRNEPDGPYQRVLVPLDLSAHSLAVAELARRVAPEAHLTLAHAFDVPFEGKLNFAGVSNEHIHRFRQEERQHAQDALQTLANSLKNEEHYDIRVKHGMPEIVIPELLREKAADMVVVGKHGQSEIVDLLLGSMTKHLLLEAPCDVLVMPPGQKAKP